MDVEIDIHKVHKIVPLKISSEVESLSEIGIVKVTCDGETGFGEIAPFSYYSIDNSWPVLLKWLPNLKILEKFSPLERVKVEKTLRNIQAPSAILAAVDMALYDWLGKKLGLPLYDILGLHGMSHPDTSLTIGISTPDEAIDRMDSWLKLGPTRLWKIKLGSPEGLDADKRMFELLAKQILKTSAKIYVDANGGWNQKQAFQMAKWLKPYGVLFIEQPLTRGQEKQLGELTDKSPVPIFADESCLHSADMQELVSGARAGCHGINIKLTKCGGIAEALRMLTLARHHNLKVMLGCFSNTILCNSAAAHISCLVDYVDLDSHLNLKDDPFSGGAVWEDGRLIPNSSPGLGVEYNSKSK